MTARRFVAVTFVLSRVAVWILALYAVLEFEPSPFPLFAINEGSRQVSHDLGLITDVWARWDSGHFIEIARHGYHGGGFLPAFFPLYPGAVALVGRILFGHYILAGILISLAASAGSFWLLYRISERHFGDEAARRAVIYLALTPMAVFLQAVYSESLFLLLALAVFVLAERGRFGAAGVAAGLALLSRPTGVALFPALALLTWNATKSVRRVALSMAGGLLFLAYPLVLRQQRGNAWGFLHAEKYWQRQTNAWGPFNGLWSAIDAAWDGIQQLLGRVPHPDLATNPDRIAVLNLEYLLFLIVFLALTVLTWRRLGAPYGLFAAISLAIPLSMPDRFYPLESLPRFGLVVFPFYMVLGQLGARRTVDRVVIGTSALLLGATTVQWALWEWVS
jgi:4-amino-4-deoxy-L-arabinose transferase-like glycosyltransferase